MSETDKRQNQAGEDEEEKLSSGGLRGRAVQQVDRRA